MRVSAVLAMITLWCGTAEAQRIPTRVSIPAESRDIAFVPRMVSQSGTLLAYNFKQATRAGILRREEARKLRKARAPQQSAVPFTTCEPQESGGGTVYGTLYDVGHEVAVGAGTLVCGKGVLH